MIDIHSHIIPNVDDGSHSVEETFKMIEEAKQAGFTDIILTSHFLLNHYETNANELVFWKEKIQEIIKENRLLTLANSRYILIELPLSSTVKYLDYVIYTLQSLSIQPIIAHPERYKYVQENPDLVEEYIEKGALIQCNYGSIEELYGKAAKKTLKILLKKNNVHFLGSDCHREGSIYLIIPQAIKKIKKIIGEDEFYKISTINPKKILEDTGWES